jgi:preprotein translocase subunit SecG
MTISLLGSLTGTMLGFLMSFLSVFLILLVLVQRGRGGGLTGALGGPGGQSAFGSKAGDTFTVITVVTAAIWGVTCVFALWLLGTHAPPAKIADTTVSAAPGDDSGAKGDSFTPPASGLGTASGFQGLSSGDSSPEPADVEAVTPAETEPGTAPATAESTKPADATVPATEATAPATDADATTPAAETTEPAEATQPTTETAEPAAPAEAPATDEAPASNN